jgi:hypothetical protein
MPTLLIAVTQGAGSWHGDCRCQHAWAATRIAVAYDADCVICLVAVTQNCISDLLAWWQE